MRYRGLLIELTVLLLALNLLDNISTHVLLTNYPEMVEEANPAAAYMFEHLGLVLSLVIECIFSAIVFFTFAYKFPMPKLGSYLVAAVDAMMVWVVCNNMYILLHLNGIL